MVVNYLDFLGTFKRPHKTNSPLIIHANTVLPLAFSFKRFKLVAWRDTKIVKNSRPINLLHLSKRRTLNVYPTTHTFTLKEGFRVFALKAFYRYASIITHYVNNFKRY